MSEFSGGISSAALWNEISPREEILFSGRAGLKASDLASEIGSIQIVRGGSWRRQLFGGNLTSVGIPKEENS